MNIKGLNFECTCGLCPEQYDVYNNNDEIVGYVRLRWGNLTCEYPDVMGEMIYHTTIGSRLTGCFESIEQRIRHLNIIADKILEKINEQ